MSDHAFFHVLLKGLEVVAEHHVEEERQRRAREELREVLRLEAYSLRHMSDDDFAIYRTSAAVELLRSALPEVERSRLRIARDLGALAAGRSQDVGVVVDRPDRKVVAVDAGTIYTLTHASSPRRWSVFTPDGEVGWFEVTRNGGAWAVLRESRLDDAPAGARSPGDIGLLWLSAFDDNENPMNP